MIRGRDIICISSIEWDFLWQGHQEINLRLARAGNRILYIENTGVRAPGIRDCGRILKRFTRWASSLGSGGVRAVAPNVYVCSPLVLPPFGPAWRRQVNRRLLLPVVRHTAGRLGLADPILWTYLPTDTALDLIGLLRTPRSTVIYYCVADFGQLTAHVRQLRESERALTESCDVVFATVPELAARCKQWNENVHLFPFGVSLEAFPRENCAPAGHSSSASTRPVSARLGSLSHPIIGYVGGIHRYMDFDLLTALAKARPHWSWVFVGAVQTAVDGLAGLPNVHLLGQKPHEELVHYIREFDACIVPYLKNRCTDTVVPTKINEYLAVGKPVVSTELPAVLQLNQQHNILLTAPAEPESFLRAIEQALQMPADEGTIGHRREVAEINSWTRRLEEMSQLIDEQLRRKEGRRREAFNEFIK